MKLFKCKLIHQGFVMHLFFREGKSSREILSDLQSFQWPAGEWEITEAGECV